MKKRFLSVVILLVLLSTMLAAPAYAKDIISESKSFTDECTLIYEFKKLNSHLLYQDCEAIVFEGDKIEIQCTLKNEGEMAIRNVHFFLACADGGTEFDQDSFMLTNGDWTSSEFEVKPNFDGTQMESMRFDLAPGEVVILTVSGKIVGNSSTLGESGASAPYVVALKESNLEINNHKVLGGRYFHMRVADRSRLVWMTILLIAIILLSVLLIFEIFVLIKLKRKIREEEKMDNEKPSV